MKNFNKVNLFLALTTGLLLVGCTATANPEVSPTPVTSTTPPVAPDVLVPIDGAIESALKSDVAMTKQNVNVFLLTNPEATVLPGDQIVNLNSGIYDISVTFNEDRTFLVTGTTKDASFTYSEAGTR